MVQELYKNLTDNELFFADHYAETGNHSGLRSMRELSASREIFDEKEEWTSRNKNIGEP